VCMHICMYVCMYACMHACMYIFLQVYHRFRLGNRIHMQNPERYLRLEHVLAKPFFDARGVCVYVYVYLTCV